MAGKVTNEGEPILLEAMVGKTAAADMKLVLFVNNLATPDGTEALASITEMSTQGYARKTLTMATWGAAAAGSGAGGASANKASIVYPEQTFTFDGTGGTTTVYGYGILNNAGTKLIAVEKFTSPAVVATSSDVVKVTPTLRLGAPS